MAQWKVSVKLTIAMRNIGNKFNLTIGINPSTILYEWYQQQIQFRFERSTCEKTGTSLETYRVTDQKLFLVELKQYITEM